MAKNATGLPEDLLDKPTMAVPGELVHKENGAPGDNNRGFDTLGFRKGPGARKGNQADAAPPAPKERAEQSPFRNLKNGRS